MISAEAWTWFMTIGFDPKLLLPKKLCILFALHMLQVIFKGGQNKQKNVSFLFYRKSVH